MKVLTVYRGRTAVRPVKVQPRTVRHDAHGDERQ
jgi:hypothetical protein